MRTYVQRNNVICQLLDFRTVSVNSIFKYVILEFFTLNKILRESFILTMQKLVIWNESNRISPKPQTIIAKMFSNLLQIQKIKATINHYKWKCFTSSRH